MRVQLLIDLPPTTPYHRATVDAIAHAAGATGASCTVRVVSSDQAPSPDGLRGTDGVVIGPGSPYRDEAAVWALIRSARERGIPLVGT